LRNVRLIAVVGTELIVVVVLDASRRQIGIAGFEILVGRARSAVQQQQSDARIVAHAFGPDLEGAMSSGDRNDAYAPGQLIGARRGVQIACGNTGEGSV